MGLKLTESQTLDLLQEECAELIHICSKIKRFGINDYHPRTGEFNKERLIQEMGDVQLLLEILKEYYDIPISFITEAMDNKRKKLVKYYGG